MISRADNTVRTSEAFIRNILLVEDDPAMAAMLTDALQTKRYCVSHAKSAAEAEALLDQVQPDLIILDLMLPDESGLVACAQFKSCSTTPIIICSATKRREDPVLGFKLGADDFVAKPFSVDELEARIEVALRRAGPGGAAASQPPNRTQRVGELVIDPAHCRVTLAGERLSLTPTEYRLLSALASRGNAVVPRHELAEQVWGYSDQGVIHSLDVHIRRLRAKLKVGAGLAPRLAILRGFGYQLVDDSEASELT